MRRIHSASLALLAVTLMLGCGSPAIKAGPRDAFWRAIDGLCGKAFGGTVVEAPAGDTTFAKLELVMHVRSCQEKEIRIPFHVGEDRSRTWVLSRTESGLRLKHDHRMIDGSEDLISQYGGDSDLPGEAGKQEFRADSLTGALIPGAANNVWTIEVEPGKQFAYALRRGGTEWRFRVEFDLTKPLPLPPAPWGSPDP